MIKRDLHQCDCDCHIYNSVRHVMPCCFTCGKCRKRIKRSSYRFHRERCKSYKELLMQKHILLTHADCLDGAGCAMVFVSAGGSKKDIHFVHANGGVKKWLDKNPEGWNSSKTLVIADVSTDHETAQLLEKRGNYVILDHHKTALHLREFDNCKIEMDCCGTAMLYEHLYGDIKMEGLVSTVADINDFDMWINAREKTPEVVGYFDFYGPMGLVERAEKDSYRLDWTEEERRFLRSLEEKKREYIERAMRRVMVVEKDDLVYGVVFVSDHRSDVLNRILQDYPDVDISQV